MVQSGHSLDQEPIFSAVASDARADRGRRDIAVGKQCVTIRRCFKGIDMRLSLAVSTYRGVALCLVSGQDGSLIYQVRLVHRDAELSIILEEALNDLDIAADWRLWARVLALPLLVEREIGCFEPAVPHSATGAPPRRKRLLKRRPRFLARRTAGDPRRSQELHAGEREIIARS